MNWIKPLTRSAFGATLLVATMAQAGGQQVTALLDDSISTYTQKNDYFVKDQPIGRTTLTLPAPVLAESARGYVKVSQQGKDMWLDMMDVTLYPPKSAGTAKCVRTTEGSSAKTGRGATESCQ